MKKRILLIITSVIAILVAVALVIYAVVGNSKSKTPTNDNTNIDNNNQSNVVVDDDPFGKNEDVAIDKNNIQLAYIEGDIIENEKLLANYALVKENFPFLSINEYGDLVAKSEGQAMATTLVGTEQLTFSIRVYRKGSGTESDPFNVVRIENLVENLSTNNSPNVYYSQVCNIDLSTYNDGNWSPIGTASKPFMANYDGNGYSIKNMNLVVTQANVEDYIDDNNQFMLGFFGVVQGGEGNNVKIKNVILSKANIDTSSIDNLKTKNSVALKNVFSNLRVSSVAILASVASNADFENVKINGTINSSMNLANAGDFNGVIAGAIGLTKNVNMTSVNAQVNFDATGVGSVVNNVSYGASVAGLVGRTITCTNISNCIVNPTIMVANYQNTEVAGAIGELYNTSMEEKDACKVENVIVIDAVISNTTKVDVDSVDYIKMAGFVYEVYDNTTVNNSIVSNITVNNEVSALCTSAVAGFAYYNLGSIVNSAVDGGIINGVNAVGFVYNNYSTISYDANFDKEYAINLSIAGQLKMAGFAYSNKGNIEAQNQVKVYSKLVWSPLNKEFAPQNGEQLKDRYMSAGFAVYNSANAKISNFNILSNMYNIVNAGGAIGYAEGKSSIDNCKVSTTMQTLAEQEGKNYSAMSDIVGGLIAVANTNAEITIGENVNIYVTVNNKNKVDETKSYSLGVFGTLIGNCQATKVTIKDTKVSAVSVNAQVKTGGVDAIDIVIGSVAGYGKTNQFSLSSGDLRVVDGDVMLANVSYKLSDFNNCND